MRELLPLGSVVLLDGAEIRIMILGYARYKEGDTSHVYDYLGCMFPEGFTGSDKTIIFDHSQIQSVYYLGYCNENSIEFMNKVTKAIENAEMNKDSE